jgi:hypothetical protein
MSKQTAIRGNERVSIYDVASGLNNNRLICECCGESLIAKKGDTNRHHFAHQANSECVYNKNANGSGGVGPAHINAQNNFCKCYNNDKISMRIKYRKTECISGRMCKTEPDEFDLKKRFPPNEYCIEQNYYYKHHDDISIFDIAILQKNNITAPPVYNIEILNKHATEEKKRMNIEWVEISAKQVNDQIVCDSRIKPILFYECRRNNNITDNKCDKCVQYTEYQRKKYEREQEKWLKEQREKDEREQRKKEKQEQEQQEKEKQEQKQREKEKRQQEQWEQEERERKKKEQEKKEQEEQEKKEKEQREREKKEQELNKWSDQVTKQMHQRNEKEKQEQEKCRQQRQNIEILSNQLFQRNPELFKTKDSPQLIGKYEKIAKKEIKPCIGCKKSKRCLTCNLKITFHAKELLISDLLKISISEC